MSTSPPLTSNSVLYTHRSMATAAPAAFVLSHELFILDATGAEIGGGNEDVLIGAYNGLLIQGANGERVVLGEEDQVIVT